MGFTPTLASADLEHAGHVSAVTDEEITVIAGYRAVRRLADSGRSTVFLGRASDAEAEVILKIAPHDERAAGEIHAIGAMDSPHIPALIDIASTDITTLCLVEPYVPAISLAEFLAIGPELSLGQWATLAIGIERGTQHAHERGYAHGSLDASHVLVHTDGTPVIIGWGSAVTLATGPTRARLTTSKRIHHESVNDDTDDVETLVGALAQLVVAEERRRAIALASIPPVAIDSRVSRLQAWEKKVFEHTEPQEIESLVSRLKEPVWELRAPRSYRVPAPEETRRSRRVVRERGSFIRALLTRRDRPLQPRKNSGQSGGSRVIATLRGIRMRTWLLLGVTVMCAALTLFLLSAKGHGEADKRVSSPRKVTASVAPSTVVSTASATAEGSESDAGLAQRAASLLRDRHRCLASGDRTCVERTDEAGSPLAGADRDAIDAGTTAENDREFQELRVTAHNGDSVTLTAAIVGNDKPASILMMRTEAGWRLRSVSIAR